MATQTFQITSAPEVKPITVTELYSLLWRNRSEGEWDVKEIPTAPKASDIMGVLGDDGLKDKIAVSYHQDKDCLTVRERRNAIDCFCAAAMERVKQKENK